MVGTHLAGTKNRPASLKSSSLGQLYEEPPLEAIFEEHADPSAYRSRPETFRARGAGGSPNDKTLRVSVQLVSYKRVKENRSPPGLAGPGSRYKDHGSRFVSYYCWTHSHGAE